MNPRTKILNLQLFGVTDTGSAVGIEVILTEMETAVEKLREDMDQIQLQIDESLGHLDRSAHPKDVKSVYFG